MPKPKIAKVILPFSINKSFDYLIPENKLIKKGTRVLVDFRGIERVGIVFSLSSQTKFKHLKPIKEILDQSPCLQSSHFQLANKLAKKYPYPPAEFLFSMLPAYLRKKNIFTEQPQLPQKKTQLSAAKKEESSSRPKPIFIKSGNFYSRYLAWKDNLKKALGQGSVIICLPQFEYLKKISQTIQNDLSIKPIEIYSRQTLKNNFSQWLKSRQNSLILGIKSALLYFPEDTRLIIVEEEASPYYLQETKPFYQLREVALALSQTTKSQLIFAGNHPSLYVYYQIKRGKIDLKEEKNDSPQISIIKRGSFEKNKYIGPVFLELIRKMISGQKKGVIIWERKYFWRIIACSNCDNTLKCQRCSGFLRQKEKSSNQALCPYCQKKSSVPEFCPQCTSGYFKGKGLGIGKLKEIISKFFPEVKLEDLEKQNNNASLFLSTSKILSYLYQKEKFDQGFILDSDSYISRLDFEATFNTFLYLKNLSLLFRDKLFLFSSRPDYYLFKYLNENWLKFYEKELSLRKQIGLPPAAKIIKVVLRSKNQEKALKNGKKIYNILKEKGQKVFGPLEEYPHKLRGKYRYSLTIKSRSEKNTREKIYPELNRIKIKDTQTAIIVK